MKWIVFLFFFSWNALEGSMLHRNLIEEEWEEENLLPFDELMLSWNAKRPCKGRLLFYVSVKHDEWSPWLLYASWGSHGQSSFKDQKPPVQIYQDAVEIKEKKATGFKIRVVAEEGASLKSIWLHVYTNGDKIPLLGKSFLGSTISLSVPRISQMKVNHKRYADLCSPTSITAAVRYLANDPSIEVIEVAEKVWDSGFDLFGNWVFNVAQGSTYLNEWHCWVERLNGFDAIYKCLLEKIPVVVSVRGPLPGSALPYARGHLLVVRGFDRENQKVLCMDPAFSQDSETYVSYDLLDFIEAWNRRGNVAYIFSKF